MSWQYSSFCSSWCSRHCLRRLCARRTWNSTDGDSMAVFMNWYSICNRGEGAVTGNRRVNSRNTKRICFKVCMYTVGRELFGLYLSECLW